MVVAGVVGRRTALGLEHHHDRVACGRRDRLLADARRRQELHDGGPLGTLGPVGAARRLPGAAGCPAWPGADACPPVVGPPATGPPEPACPAALAAALLAGVPRQRDAGPAGHVRREIRRRLAGRPRRRRLPTRCLRRPWSRRPPPDGIGGAGPSPPAPVCCPLRCPGARARRRPRAGRDRPRGPLRRRPGARRPSSMPGRPAGAFDAHHSGRRAVGRSRGCPRGLERGDGREHVAGRRRLADGPAGGVRVRGARSVLSPVRVQPGEHGQRIAARAGPVVPDRADEGAADERRAPARPPRTRRRGRLAVARPNLEWAGESHPIRRAREAPSHAPRRAGGPGHLARPRPGRGAVRRSARPRGTRPAVRGCRRPRPRRARLDPRGARRGRRRRPGPRSTRRRSPRRSRPAAPRAPTRSSATSTRSRRGR